MSRLSLAGKVDALVTGDGEPVPERNLVGISIDALTIDTGQFRSRDLSGRREGVVAITIAGQESLFTFSGKGRIEIPCHSQLAYLGTNPGALPIAVRVVELDTDIRRTFEAGQEIAKIAARAASAFPSPFTDTGLGVVSALMGLLAKLCTDDDEVAAFAVVEEPLSHGSTIALHFGSRDRPAVCLVTRFMDMGKRQTFRMAGIRLLAPWLEFGGQRVSMRERAVNGKGYRRRRLTVEDWLVREKSLRSLVFSAASGRHKAGIVSRFQHAASVFNWHKWELFRVAASRAGDRHVVPLSAAFSLNSSSDLVEPVIDLIRTSLDLAEEIDPRYEQAAKVVRKAGRGFADLISEIGSSELPLFQFDGALMLLPESTQARKGVLGGTIELPQTGKGVWRTEVVTGFGRWGKPELGRMGFGIEVVAY